MAFYHVPRYMPPTPSCIRHCMTDPALTYMYLAPNSVSLLMSFCFVHSQCTTPKTTKKTKSQVHRLFMYTSASRKHFCPLRSVDDDDDSVHTFTKASGQQASAWEKALARPWSSTWFDVFRTSSCTTWLSCCTYSGFVLDVDGLDVCC